MKTQKILQQRLISSSLSPAAATTPRKWGEVSLPHTAQRANLWASPLFSFPSPTRLRASRLLQLAIWGLCVLRRWEGVGRGRTQTRRVAGRSPRRLVRGCDVTQPSCSPSAPPLLSSVSSRSPHPRVTVRPCQFHSQVQAIFLLFSGFLRLIPLCGFLSNGLSSIESQPRAQP